MLKLHTAASALFLRNSLERLGGLQQALGHGRRAEWSGIAIGYRERSLLSAPHFVRWRSNRNAANEEDDEGNRVLLIRNDGKKHGEMSEREARSRAEEEGFSLKSVGQMGQGVTVMKMVDMEAEERTKRLLERQQRKRRLENRRLTTVKGIRVSPTTDEHDFEIKMRKAKEFLESGRSVKVFVMFKRGQGKLQQEAEDSLVKAVEALKDWGEALRKEETPVIDDGKRKPLEILIKPLKKRKKESQNAS